MQQLETAERLRKLVTRDDLDERDILDDPLLDQAPLGGVIDWLRSFDTDRALASVIAMAKNRQDNGQFLATIRRQHPIKNNDPAELRAWLASL